MEATPRGNHCRQSNALEEPPDIASGNLEKLQQTGQDALQELTEDHAANDEEKQVSQIQAEPGGSQIKRDAVNKFKQKLQETLSSSIIGSPGSGRAKRKAAAVAGERIKVQMDQERGGLRKAKPETEQQKTTHASGSEGQLLEQRGSKRDWKQKAVDFAASGQKDDQESSKCDQSEVSTKKARIKGKQKAGEDRDRRQGAEQGGTPAEQSSRSAGTKRRQLRKAAEPNGATANASRQDLAPPVVKQEIAAVRKELGAVSTEARTTTNSSPASEVTKTQQPGLVAAASSSGADSALAGLTVLAASAGRLPKRLTGCAYDPASRNWVPRGCTNQVSKASRPSLLTGYSHQVENAKSSAAACKGCGEKILKGLTRVGYPVKDHRGEYGAIVNWFHPKCCRQDVALTGYAKMGDTRLQKSVMGYDNLTKDEKASFRDELLRSPDAQQRPEDMELLPAESAVRTLPRHEPPASLKVPMLAFQAEGLGWMLAREADDTTRGGILADEMGMGKTLQTISLLLSGENKGPTLVVCPAAAMLQWRNEVLRFTEPGSLDVRLYYGSDRRSDLDGVMEDSLAKRIVVLTTYPTMEAEYRKEVNKTKVQCQWCGRFFIKGKLVYHQKYFCGPDAERTEKQQKTQLKSEAVKKMKIGGTETDIVLNPLNAIRAAATQAFRKHSVRKDQGEAPAEGRRGPIATPFPASVLPEEARVALGYTRKDEGADDKALPSTGKDVEQSAAGTPPPQKRKWRMRSKAPDELKSSGQCDKVSSMTRDVDCQAGEKAPEEGIDAAGQASPGIPTPSAPSAPRKRWALGTLSTQIEHPCQASAASRFAFPSSNSWGKALQSRRPVGAVIELMQSDNESSDLELMREEVRNEGDAGLAFGSSSSSSSKSKPTSSGEPLKAETSGARDPDSEEDGCGDFLDLSHSPLFRVVWGRIVLDEAHRIKSRQNSTAQAAFALGCSGSRWCLSGTPLQNKVGDFWSIIRFVRFYPWAHYLCSKKGCSCSSLHYRFDAETQHCRKCGHSKMQHRSHFSKEVLGPISKFGFVGTGKTAMEKLRREVLERILLRRTKLERQADVNLPTLEIRIRKDTLSPQEQDFYTSMFTQSRTSFDTFVDKGTLLHNYAHVFDLIMRLRQAVDHPYLIVHGLKSSDPSVGLMPSKSRGDADVCALCQDDIEDRANRAKAGCGHIFHKDCLSEYLEQAPQLPSGGVGCPTCFLPVTWADGQADPEEADEGDIVADLSAEEEEAPQGGPAANGGKSGFMRHIRTSEFQSSTKIEALVHEIKRMSSEDPTSKALVFSQFSRFLELIEWRLKREGVSAAKVLGSMPIVSRNNIIVSFQTEPTLKVLLISLKAGGEGLNLQAANHIFIMDPWWNPAAELQAIQRAHRIGQTRPVKATRFVAANTIEEKIIELQQKKQSVFDCTVGNSNKALQRLTAEDIQFLFTASS
eukprot:TRINITY_DN23096_c0_g1_i1.p1 TRINITY_DN23096_c0_g1~~TRINITY_DN23096_c0_g1_i1.p1  ORF type:complete len:1439 (-),score=300.93 TRINITY_DN23096_c0_g1_i1:174-4490(-)